MSDPATRVSTIGSSFDTLLGVYTGTAMPPLAQVAADDNDAYGDVASVVTLVFTLTIRIPPVPP